MLLRREHNNPHDINAIAIYAALGAANTYEWTKVGYVPRSTAEYEFAGLDDRTIIEAKKYGSQFKLSGKTRKYV